MATTIIRAEIDISDHIDEFSTKELQLELSRRKPKTSPEAEKGRAFEQELREVVQSIIESYNGGLLEVAETLRQNFL